MINVFSGKLYISKLFDYQTRFTDFWKIGTSLATSAGIELSTNASVVIETKASAKIVNKKAADETISDDVTGKAIIKIDSVSYENINNNYNGEICEVRLIDYDCDRMVQVVRAKINIVPITKISDIITAEFTFNYKQASNIDFVKKRYRLVTLDPDDKIKIGLIAHYITDAPVMSSGHIGLIAEQEGD